MKRLLLLLLTTVLLLIANSCLAQEPTRYTPSQLKVEESILQVWSNVAKSRTDEFILCLDGTTIGDTATIQGVTVPKIYEASSMGIISDGCPGDQYLASWHTHPPQSPGEAASSRNFRCHLSAVDVRTAILQDVQFAVVQVDEKRYCWWSRYQIEFYPFLGAIYIPGIPGQIVDY